MDDIELMELDLGESGPDKAEMIMLIATSIADAARRKGVDPRDAMATLRRMADEEPDK